MIVAINNAELQAEAIELDIDQAIELFCLDLTDNANVHEGEDSICRKVFHAPQKGRRYTRIVCSNYVVNRETGEQGLNGESAYMFVDRQDGSIWKPASWKGPTKNFSRGNVYKSEVTNYSPYGI